jgi:hypothetical protein
MIGGVMVSDLVALLVVVAGLLLTCLGLAAFDPRLGVVTGGVACVALGLVIASSED